jgi:hypothetical protein
MADKRYLQDITGRAELPDLNKLLESQGLLGLLPDSVKEYAEELATADEKGVHSYLCHIDKLPKNQDCDTSKALAAREKNRYVGVVQFSNEPPYQLYVINGLLEKVPSNKKAIAITGDRFKTTRKARTSNMGSAVIGQGKKANKPVGTLYLRGVNDDRKRDTTNFEKAVEGEKGQSIGTRAVLFNHDGSVTLGANNIRDNAVAIERSADIASENVSNGSIPKKRVRARDYSTKFHPNKKKIAGTDDVAAGIAALGGVTAMTAIVAMLTPMHFITSAITFLTSITTMFTNVNNVVNTFLTISDALLGLLGIKNSSKGLKTFLGEMVDNAFGKERVQNAKNLFAKCINSTAVATKLLEKVQSMRQGTNNKVDELALQLGTVNNSLGAAGLIPPELMQTSGAIDEFVGKRDTEGNELKENIDLLTGEILDKDEATQRLLDEQKVRDKRKAVTEKDTADVKALVDASKTELGDFKLDDL